MDQMKILLIGCALLTFENSISCEDKYELITVKGVTEVPHTGKIPYPDGQPAADTDTFTEDKRIELCRKGFELVQTTDNGVIVQFFPDTKTDTLKTYVLTGRNNIIDVVSAYKCPINFPTYIHVKVKVENDKPVPTYLVIFEWNDDPLPKFRGIQYFGLKLADEIVEANAEEIASAKTNEIDVSLYNTNELTEEQRLQMCRRATLIASALNIKLTENTKTGTSKYFRLISKSSKQPEKSPRTLIYVEAFACPTDPIIYVHLDDIMNGLHVLQAITLRSEIMPYPTLGIMGYEIVNASVTEIDSVKTEEVLNMTETEEVRSDMDELTDQQRRDMCDRTLHTITGEPVKFIYDIVPPVQYYAIDGDENRATVLDSIKAIQCPTNPPAYLRIVKREDYEIQVWVIVGKEDYQRLTSKF